jgi:MipA family protein
VKKYARDSRKLLLAMAAVFLSSSTAWAEGAGADPSNTENTGLAILNNATNVTHWGLGAGVGIQGSPYKGYGSKVVPIPLLYFDDKWVHAFGTTIDLKVGTWSHVSIALRGHVGLFDGYSQSDAPILNGMEDRRGAFWYGPALEWHTAFGTLSGEYLLGGNKGEEAQIDYSKSFDLGAFSIEPYAGAQWLSHKYVDYYYGVRPSEVRPDRPAYTGTATWNLSAGTRVNYSLTAHQKIMLDIGVAHQGSGITDSPLVGRRYVPVFKIGYLYQFQ